MPIRLGLVGVGKIALDQHIPTITADDRFELIAAASPRSKAPGVPTYPTTEAMLVDQPAIEAVAMCQSPQVRFQAALAAIAAGKHVLLEKPPGATIAEVGTLEAAAHARGVTLFASWHSRHAAGVEPARDWLAGKRIRSARILWKEDVRRWHPGQEWIWQPGGLGVFDPGINALSIATHILPAFSLRRGILFQPANRAMPIAAELGFETVEGAAVDAEFDFRQTGEQVWDVAVETDAGSLLLSGGGTSISIGGEACPLAHVPEYAALYGYFHALIAAGESDVDLRPMIHVADAFLGCERRTVEPFEGESG